MAITHSAIGRYVLTQVKAKVAVIIPAFNVRSVLRKTIESLPKDCADEVIVIDDGSTDGTKELAKELGLVVISHERNRGYGGAQKTGYQEAIKSP